MGDRKITLCRELTKRFESVQATTLLKAVDYYEKQEPRGEYVLVLEGLSRKQMQEDEQDKWNSLSIEEHMQFYLEQGMDKKEAMKKVATDRGTTKREIYQALL